MGAYNKDLENNIRNKSHRDLTIDDFMAFFSDRAVSTNNGDAADAYINNMLSLIMRDEDYRRSLPTTQLAQLMQTGMSRAAAIAALQGGGESSPADLGAAGNVEEATSERINAIGGAVQAGVNAAYTGASLYMAVPSYQMQRQQAQYYPQILADQSRIIASNRAQSENAANLSNRQYEALGVVGELNTAIAAYKSSHPDFEPFANVSDMLSFQDKKICSEDFTGMMLQDIIRRNAPSLTSDVIAYQTMQNNLDDRYMESYINGVVRRQHMAAADLADLNVQMLGHEITDLCVRIDNDLKSGELLDQDILLAGARIGLTEAETKQILSETWGINLDNAEHAVDFQNNLRYFNPLRIMESVQQLKFLSNLDDQHFKNAADVLKNQTKLDKNVAAFRLACACYEDKPGTLSNETIKYAVGLDNIGILKYYQETNSYNGVFGMGGSSSSGNAILNGFNPTDPSVDLRIYR